MFGSYKTRMRAGAHNAGMNRRELLTSGAAAGLVAGAGAPSAFAAGAAPLVPPKSGQILVTFVAGRNANVIDIAGAWEVFQDTIIPVPGSDMGQMPFRMAVVSEHKDAFPATGGLQIVPQYTLADSVPQPNVIVMGAQGEHTPEKIAWIREHARNADVVMSVCTGAFLLAKTGLLDGLSATTHHDFYDKFAAQFPQITLVRGPRYVENENGKLCTAGGLTSGIELALRVVGRYFGDAAAAKTAYYMEYKPSPERPAP